MHSTRLLMLLCAVAFGLPVTLGEMYYQASLIRSAVWTPAASQQGCITQCLSSSTCSAVSYCRWPGTSSMPTCAIALCSNILLLSNADCTTIVFLDLQLREGYNVLPAAYEWPMTDSCGGNIGLDPQSGYTGAPRMTISGTGTVSSVPSQSAFSGMSRSGLNLQLSASVLLNVSSPVVVVLWFKTLATATNFTIAELQSTTPNFNINLRYSSGTLVLTYFANFMTSAQVAWTAPDGWTYAALAYDSSTVTTTAFINSVPMLKCSANYSLGSLSTNNVTATLNIGGESSSQSTVYCVKLFKEYLSVGDLKRVADSCARGKIVRVGNAVGAASTWFSDSKLVNLVSTVNYSFLLFCNYGPNYLPWTVGKSRCESMGYQLAQLDTPELYKSFVSMINSSNATGCQGTSIGYVYVGGLWNDAASSFKWTASGTLLTVTSCIKSGYAPSSNCSYAVYKKTGATIQSQTQSGWYTAFACSSY